MKNFTSTTTIYCLHIKTTILKIHGDYLASSEISLQTAVTPYDVYEVLRTIYSTLEDDQEHLILLILNAAQEMTGYKLIASGTQDYTYVDNKILFRNALLLGASSIIVAHNHPSGQLDPSTHDLTITQKLIAGSKLLDIDVLDHIIYTHKGYTSLRQTHPHLFAEA